MVTHGTNPRATVGYKLDRYNLDAQVGVPLSIGGEPSLFLGIQMRLECDDEQKYLMVTSSVLVLSVDADLEQTLLHYDYEREKSHGYPEAHVQINATSPDWELSCTRSDGNVRALRKLHLPVGGRRFRPTLEDFIEFLILEKLTLGREGWERSIKITRDEFHHRQLKAAIRRNPALARQCLIDEGLLDDR
ncbi:hypothetical protein [Rhodococcus sp. 14-2483-1-2]|uniref:hypothetical protein n=1 Tax=Rhodococcus sp. 14-2483-1-2 TaxID=2023147 RepID=UPI00207B7270|nr:hypothetical protein [Rhodococcus sp. 14-2483-1-2]